MFDQLFKRDSTVRRYIAAPLARSRLDYLSHCERMGAKPATLKPIAFIQVAAVQYLELCEQGSVSLSRIEAAAVRWASEAPERRGGSTLRRRQRFVRYAKAWLRFAGRLEVPACESDPHAAEVRSFADFMHRERGLSKETIRSRCCTVRQFLRWFDDGNRSLSDIRIADIDGFLDHKATRTSVARSSVRHWADSLRAFFCYAEQQGWTVTGLAATAPLPRVYADERLPAGPSGDEVRQLLATTEGERPADRRDHAILLLLARYGFRAGEVAGLRLDDIDWEAEILRVRHSKSGLVDQYPLIPQVGRAILDYLREVRPERAYREIFLTLKAPIVPVSSTGVSQLVGQRIRRLGLNCQRRGAHSLRHAFAQRLLEADVPMREIGDFLGHRSLDSTAVYARADLKRLRQVAEIDLEGLA